MSKNWHFESGPPKSGKTTRLIKKANEMHAAGKRVVFHSYEHGVKTLLERGLHPDIRVIYNASGDEAVQEYPGSWRKCYRVTFEECPLADIKRGDFFLLDGGLLDLTEPGTVINLAGADAKGNCVQCRTAGEMVKPLGDLLDEVK